MMGDQEETQEQMKADMSALKNMATAADVSSAAEADPTLLATPHHPPPNTIGRGRSTLGHNRDDLS